MSGLNMTDPMPDIPRLRKAVEWMEEQAARPEVEREWYQQAWRLPATDLSRSCGTCYCVAGKVVEDAGFTPVNSNDTGSLAQTLLGITDSERADLFYAFNKVEDVRRIAESIAARVGERL